MKTLYSILLLLCFTIITSAQRVVSVNPDAIPSTGSVTLTIRCHNAFLLSRGANQVRLFQPTNSDGSIYYCFTPTVIDNDHLTATFTITNPTHGGYYNVAVFQTGYIVNFLKNAVYMTGVDERRLLSAEPNYGFAGTTLTSLVTGTGTYFMSSTGFQWIGYMQMQSEIDNSIITASTISYADSNHVTPDFTLPSTAVNGRYNLMVDLTSHAQTNMPRMFYMFGGINKRITSVTPHEGAKGATVFLNVHVIGRNLITDPVTSATLMAESAVNYSIYTSGAGITTVDSNNLILRFTLTLATPFGDYALQLNNNLTKHYAFRVMPPNITGNVFFDANSNGVKDGLETGIGGQRVMLLPDSIVSITDNLGNYFYYADSGNYQATCFPDSIYSITTAASYNISVDDSVISGINFGIFYCCPQYNHPFNVNVYQLRCNINGQARWSIYNPTYTNQTGTITHVHSPNLLFTSATITPDSVNGDTLKWNYSINPGQTISCTINYLVPGAGSVVWLEFFDDSYDTLGTVAHHYESRTDRTILCSYDPNDKSVIPAEDATHPTTPAGSDLIYTIRFQNTGNDTAFLVTIVDTLNANLDLNSFEVLGASHLVYTNISLTEHTVTFRFDNILLPDSSTDYDGSNGFVRFKIRALQGVPDSTVVTNTSYIYFDFNPYVETNTTSNLLTYYHPPVAAFSATTSLCPTDCINFTNNSLNATSWQWSFAGASPSTSTDQNPVGICYAAAGAFEVSLIATDGITSNTLTLPNYIVVNPAPPAPAVSILNDTLFASYDSSYISYQWYDSLGIISGATNSWFVPMLSATYGVLVTNSYGCTSLTAVTIIVGVTEIRSSQFEIYPNPASDVLTLLTGKQSTPALLTVFNTIGEKVVEKELSSGEKKTILDLKNIPAGIYLIRYESSGELFVKRFVKQ
jgi:uncharacterized repeat protein (TIGR01451 family)